MNMKKYEISSAVLHVLGMLFMLLDHTWAVVLPNQVWMTWVGRLAFPIFAFLTAEGFFHTHDCKRYLLRMLLFAAAAEIPFDRMYSGLNFYPYHQNVLWTLLIALICMHYLEKIRNSGKLWMKILSSAGVVLLGFLAATIGMTDYYGTGVLTVLTFYFFRKRNWFSFLGQLAALYWLNTEILGGLYYPITILGFHFELVQQSLAVLALIPIWLYRGKKGNTGKAFQYFCYAFYPVHCFILSLL